MGQEKSLPDRCNSSAVQPTYLRTCNSTSNLTAYSSSSSASSVATFSRPPSRAPSTTKSYAPSSYSTTTNATASTTISASPTHYSHQTTNRRRHGNGGGGSSSSYTTTTTRGTTQPKPESKQTKYLKEQLYIKSYLDIVEQDRTARSHFPAAKPGIRNYTPKILVEEPPPNKEVDVWI